MTTSDLTATSPFSQELTSNELQPMQSPDSVFLVASLEQKFDTVWKGSSNHEQALQEYDSVNTTMADPPNRQTANERYFVLYPLKEIRDAIFHLSASVGTLASKMVEIADESSGDTNPAQGLSSKMVVILVNLLRIADLLSISLADAVPAKVELNCRKYPIHLCKGKSGKYTEYSSETGITKEQGQVTGSYNDVVNGTNEAVKTKKSSLFIMNIRKFSSILRQFATDREWQKFHTPRNLLLALIGEVGELAELVQFKGDNSTCGFSASEIDKLGQELADVTIYLLRLGDVCGIDLFIEGTSSSNDEHVALLEEFLN